MDTKNYSRHIELSNVVISDGFWSDVQKTVNSKVIPYQYEALNDRIENAEKSYCVENFKKASEIVRRLRNGEKPPVYPVDKWVYDENNSDENAFHGWVFQDSDAYKWLEAAAYSLQREFDSQLYDRCTELIDIICSAQMENGYLDTLYIINDRDMAFSNLRDFHELYCFGHLAEAGVAFYYATGNKRLIWAAVRFADLICEVFGENGKAGYGGHEIAELGMIKLYEATGKEEYLKAARLFVDRRGTRPFYFDIERGITTDGSGYKYNQAHLPVREQNEAVGHAVRGVYLYSAMADLSRLTNDDSMYEACMRIWENITQKKMYITGGIGATVDGEAFSFDYDLPNDLAYCETCASIGLIFFARRMLEIKANAQIADTVERALYNTVLSGMNIDGDRFFYVNPLEVLPKASREDSRKHHIKTTRQKWFGCACCPPNLARLIGSLGEYCYTENDDTVFVHQYIGSSVQTKFGRLDVKSHYTENGHIEITADCQRPFTLALRIPSWCDEYKISANAEIKDGYAYVGITEKCELLIDFELKPRLVKCSNFVRENTDKLALCYGPSVYCLEAVDNGDNLQLLKLDLSTDFECGYKWCTQSNMPIPTVVANGFREKPDERLYSDFASSKQVPCKLTFIPYRFWSNRGETEMSVYFRYTE